MLIYGHKGVIKEVASGQFFCPYCEGSRKYRRYRVAENSTNYYITLFPIKNFGEFIECQGCFTPLDIDILDKTKPITKVDVSKTELVKIWKDYFDEIGVDEIPENVKNPYVLTIIPKFKEAGAYLAVGEYQNARESLKYVLDLFGEYFKCVDNLKILNMPNYLDSLTASSDILTKFVYASTGVLRKTP
jgi:hypothetical protein